jgi:hypothetical protein
MNPNDIHVPSRMQFVLGNADEDMMLMRNTIMLVMMGEYPNRTEVLRAGLRLVFADLERRRADRERVLRQEE